MMGQLIHTTGFVVPHNPVVRPNVPNTGNPVLATLRAGCRRAPCYGRINGMGSFDVFGFSVPGEKWMWLLAAGAAAGIYLMSGHGK